MNPLQKPHEAMAQWVETFVSAAREVKTAGNRTLDSEKTMLGSTHGRRQRQWWSM
jgi:hypothetical protein